MPHSTLGGRQPMGAVDNPVRAGLTEAEAVFLDRGQPADPGFVVGMIDTGVVAHPFLDGHTRPLGPGDTDPMPVGELAAGHGTVVAGRILLEAPTATVVVRAALRPPYRAAGQDTDAAVAAAIRDFAAVDGLLVLNLSFAGSWTERSEPAGIAAALTELLAARPQLLVVAATANRWTDAPSWPAAFGEEFDRVVPVGAVDETIVLEDPGLGPPPAAFASRWPGIGVRAGGVRVLGPSPFGTGGWVRWSGTSLAAATVTGILAQALHEGELRDWRSYVAEHSAAPPGVRYLRSAELTALGYVGGGDA
ncbi:MAG TPA: S8/S53 family peptidase [Mycobacteriales bacterium]|nr:S8/S53 family peptidase [Mycobacteriales bacterium]